MGTNDWFADETFWKTFYPFIFSPERFEAAGREAEAVLGLLGSRPATLLDLACGPGRHSVAFAGLGIAVTGVDLSPFLLDKARELAASRGVAVEWVEADMRDFARPGAFDAAVNLFTSFGYFEDDMDNLQVAANLFTSLKPGGALVLDLVGKEVAARAFQRVVAQEVEGRGLFIQRPRAADDWCRMENEWVLIRDGVARTFRFRHWLYSARELRRILRGVGFEAVRFFGSLEGGEYGPEAQRLVAVARKPA